MTAVLARYKRKPFFMVFKSNLMFFFAKACISLVKVLSNESNVWTRLQDSSIFEKIEKGILEVKWAVKRPYKSQNRFFFCYPYNLELES